MSEDDRKQQGLKPTPAPDHRWQRRFLRLCGSQEIDEATLDLDEESRRRRAAGEPGWRIRCWGTWQILGIGLYELRDMRLRRRHRTFHPLLALRLAGRSLRRQPGVPIAAALTLGLGFGAAAAIYGVYSGFRRPLPVPDGAALHWIRVLDERGRSVPMRHDEFEVLRAANSTFEALGGFASFSATVRFGGKHAVRAQGAAMTPEVFEMLQVIPARGRPLLAADHDAVVVSHDFWVAYLDKDAALGDTLRVDGVDRVVVGVMPEGHRFPFNHDLWTVMEPAAVDSIETVARIRPDSNPELAAADAGRILEELRRERGSEPLGLRVEVPSFTEKRGESGENVALATMLALVVALVLVSCSNVSNLLFARALTRVDRLVVHAALGAAPAQVALQMFCEALLISVAGAAVGLGLSALAIDYIESTLSGHWGFYWMAVRFEPGVVTFTLSLAVVTGVISGMMPALRLWRADLGEVLKSDSAGVVGGSRRRFSAVLLNGQVAFSCFALVIAMLLAGGLLRSEIAADFPAEDVFVAALSLESSTYDEAKRRRSFRESLLDALRSDDAITDAALSNVPPGLSNSVSRLEIEGVRRDPDARPDVVAALAVSPSYFAILGADLTGGRGFTALDSLPGEHVAVVSESFARRHLPTADALGQRLRLEQLTGADWLRIVGVVADVAEYAGADERLLARVYVPFARVDPRDAYVVYTGRPAAATGGLRATIAALDPDVAVTGVFGRQAETRVADVMRYVRRIYLTGGVLAMIGGVAAAIVALIGLYGALAFEVQRRVAEIGVRMALGATYRDVLLHTTIGGLARVGPGLLLGLVMSAGVSPLLGALLGGMNPLDPAVHLGVYFAFLAVAIIAAVVPARHAARLDPVTVLRKD